MLPTCTIKIKHSCIMVNTAYIHGSYELCCIYLSLIFGSGLVEPSGFFVAWAISTMTEPIHDLANVRWMAAQLILVLGLLQGLEALENGLGQTPAMGYNTWNDFQCEGVSARNISKVADKMVALGLPKLGYKYLIIDDCWAVGRTTAGVLIPDPEAFPDGMKSVADYVHAKAERILG